MEPVIRKLIIQGFRSFRSEVVEFDNPTFLVGCNGSGKSNLLDALAFLSEAMTTPLTEVFSWRGGGRIICHGSSMLLNEEDHRTLGIEIVLGAINHEISAARYAFQIAVTGARRPTYVVQRGDRPGLICSSPLGRRKAAPALTGHLRFPCCVE